jgi:hypothetical protein
LHFLDFFGMVRILLRLNVPPELNTEPAHQDVLVLVGILDHEEVVRLAMVVRGCVVIVTDLMDVSSVGAYCLCVFQKGVNGPCDKDILPSSVAGNKSPFQSQLTPHQ